MSITPEQRAEWREDAERYRGNQNSGRILALLDALEAAEAALAQAWDEGYDAGDSDARSVQKSWPDLTVNPYRDHAEPGTPEVIENITSGLPASAAPLTLRFQVDGGELCPLGTPECECK